MIELRHLDYIVRSNELGSFNKVAEGLGIKQITISRHILHVEDKLGVKLFDRSFGGVQPTYAGRRALAAARSVLAEVSALIDDMHAYRRGEHGRIRLGLATMTPAGFRHHLPFREGWRQP